MHNKTDKSGEKVLPKLFLNFQEKLGGVFNFSFQIMRLNHYDTRQAKALTDEEISPI